MSMVSSVVMGRRAATYRKLGGGGGDGVVIEIGFSPLRKDNVEDVLMIKLSNHENAKAIGATRSEFMAWKLAQYAVGCAPGKDIAVPDFEYVEKGMFDYGILGACLVNAFTEENLWQEVETRGCMLIMRKAPGVGGERFIETVVRKELVATEQRKGDNPKIFFSERFYANLGMMVAIDFFIGNVDRLPLPIPVGNGPYKMDTFNLSNVLISEIEEELGEFRFSLIDNNLRAPRIQASRMPGKMFFADVLKVMEKFSGDPRALAEKTGNEILTRLLAKHEVGSYIAKEVDREAACATGKGFVELLATLLTVDNVEGAAATVRQSLLAFEKADTAPVFKVLRAWSTGTSKIAQATHLAN